MEITKSMRVPIITKYLPCTNTLGSRVKATAPSRPGKSYTVSFHCECPAGEDAHDAAARMYCDMMHWTNDLYRADTDTGAVFLMTD